jgi:Peroxiredoxin
MRTIKTLFAIVAILFAFAQTNILCAQSIPFGQGYTINGTIKGQRGEQTGFVTLRSYFCDGNERVDTCYLNKGKFHFISAIEEKIPALLTVNGLRSYRIYLEPATYEIEIKGTKADDISIKGSPETQRWLSLVTPVGNEDYYVHLKRLNDWVLNNPEDIFCADIISSFLCYNWQYEELYRTLNTLKKPATKTYHYIHLRQRQDLLRSLATGNRAPDFTMLNTKKQNINLYSYIRGKKCTLIDFWASWCKDCREENPNVVAAYNKYNQYGFNILGVSLDNDKERWLKAIKDDRLTWEQVSDLKQWQNKVAEQYLIREIPSNVLVDSKGNILAKNLKGEQLMSFLENYLTSDGYKIEGNIAALPDGEAKLTLFLENGMKKNFTAPIKDGKFVFKGSVDFVCMAQLTLPVKNGDISFFIDNDKVSITGQKDALDNVVIKGSAKQDIYNSVIAGCNREKNPMQCLLNSVQTDPTTFYAPLLISSYLAPYLKDNELKEIFNSLDGSAKRMYQYKILEDYIDKLGSKETQDATYNKYIDFTLPNVEGTDVKLSDFLKGKKYVLVDFWASWCTPCRNESKYVVAAYRDFKDKGFDVLGVSLDTDRARWIQAINNDGLKYTNVSDLLGWNSIASKLYKLEAIPSNILIDQNGNIIAKDLRGETLANFLRTLNWK